MAEAGYAAIGPKSQKVIPGPATGHSRNASWKNRKLVFSHELKETKWPELELG
jgi:hypothetical protein